MFAVGLWWIKIQEEDFLLIFHDIMISTFKFGGNRRFFGVYTANFVWCRGGARAIPLPVPHLCRIRYHLSFPHFLITLASDTPQKWSRSSHVCGVFRELLRYVSAWFL